MSEFERDIDIEEDTVYFTLNSPDKRSPDFDFLIDSDGECTRYDLLVFGEGNLQRGIDLVFSDIQKRLKGENEFIPDMGIEAGDGIIATELGMRSFSDDGRLDSFSKGIITSLIFELDEFGDSFSRIEIPDEEGTVVSDYEELYELDEYSEHVIFPYDEPEVVS